MTKQVGSIGIDIEADVAEIHNVTVMNATGVGARVRARLLNTSDLHVYMAQDMVRALGLDDRVAPEIYAQAIRDAVSNGEVQKPTLVRIKELVSSAADVTTILANVMEIAKRIDVAHVIERLSSL